MFSFIGKGLQVFALVVLPLAMYLELSGALDRSFGLNEMLIMMLFGIVAFILGRYVEGWARPR